MLAPCPNPSINMSNITCHMLNFINVMCKFMCDMRYLICCMFSFISNVSLSIYGISISLCSLSESIYGASKNPFACFNSFITCPNIAFSVLIFVASSLLCCIRKIIHWCSELFIFIGRFLAVIFRHDFSLWSNTHKVHYVN